jgi:hypothetical protein
MLTPFATVATKIDGLFRDGIDNMFAMRGVVRIGTLALTLAVTINPVDAQRPSDSALEDLLARARQSNVDFLTELSNVVAEERYVQDSSAFLPVVPIPGLTRGAGRGALPPLTMTSTTAKHRELKSDFLIDRSISNQLQPFRDVFEVDGVPIRDREQRLAKVFLAKKGDLAARAKEIAEEGARYNLGSVERTINHPLFALMYLETVEREHVRFTLGKTDRIGGVAVRIVEFVEEGRPTIVIGRPGEEMPAFGRFWIESETGRLVKAEVRIERKDIKANLTTEFRADERLGINVPSQMHERYELPDSTVTGLATYSRFRRFGVESKEEVTPPVPDAAPPPR